MKCKHCECEVLGQPYLDYCSQECEQREIVEAEIQNFILYITHKNGSKDEPHIFYDNLDDYMREVYSYQEIGHYKTERN